MLKTVLTDKRSINELSTLLEFCSELVIKDEDKANETETRDSMSKGYRLINAMLRTDNFIDYEITKQDLLDLDNSNITYSIYSINKIPENLLEEVIEYKRYQIYREYMMTGDLNPYYENIFKQHIKDEEPIMSFEEFKQNTNLCFYVVARLAKNFSLLWYPKDILSSTEVLKYRKCFLNCQQYYLKVCYNEAFKVANPKFNNLSTLTIVFMTIKKYLNSRLENIDDIDFFDEYSIRNMFLSYGLDYFFDMPLKYQKRVLKNLNYLIKNKGTNKAIISILEMFGFSSIKVMKYFLCKEYPKDENGKLMLTEPELKFYGVDSEDNNIEHALKHATVTDYDKFVAGDKYWQIEKYVEGEPGVYSNDYNTLLAEPFNYVYSKYISIEGVMDINKSAIDFSYYINFLYRLKEKVENDPRYSHSLYFYNYSLSNKKIDLIDSIFLLYAIVLKMYGYKDIIVKTVSGIGKVYDFNLDKETTPILFMKKAINREDVILNDYAEYIPIKENVSDSELFDQQKIVTVDYDISEDGRKLISRELDIINSQLITYEWCYLEDYTLNKFKQENLVDFAREVNKVNFVKQFTTNQKFRKHLEQIILATHDREFYRKYMAYYKRCFLSHYRSNIFGPFDTFTAYLRVNDPTCYEVLEKIQSKIEETPADEEIIYYEYILELCNSIDTYLDNNEMDFMVQGNIYLTDYIKQFVYEMVEFIRAYTIHVKDISTIYLFDERFLNKFKFFDETEWDNIQKYTLLYKFNDKLVVNNNMKLPPDKMFEFVKEIFDWTTRLTFEDKLKLEELLENEIVFKIADLVRFKEDITTENIMTYIESAVLKEKFKIGETQINIEKEKFTFKDFLEVVKLAIGIKDILPLNDDIVTENNEITDIIDMNIRDKILFDENSYEIETRFKFRDKLQYDTGFTFKDHTLMQDELQIVNEFTNIEQFNMKEKVFEIDHATDNLLIFKDTLDEECKVYENAFIVKYNLNNLVTKKVYIKRQDEMFFINQLGAVQFYIAGDTKEKFYDFVNHEGILVLSKSHGILDYIAMTDTKVEFDPVNLLEGEINNE